MSTLKKLQISEVESQIIFNYELLRLEISIVLVYQNLFRKHPLHSPWL